MFLSGSVDGQGSDIQVGQRRLDGRCIAGDDDRELIGMQVLECDAGRVLAANRGDPLLNPRRKCRPTTTRSASREAI